MARAASTRTRSAADCAQSTSRIFSPRLWTVSLRWRKTAPTSAVAGVGKRHALGWSVPSGRRRRAPAAAALGRSVSAAWSAATAPGLSSESSLSSSAKRPRARCRSAVSFSPLPRRWRSAITSVTTGWLRAAAADPSFEALSSTSTSVGNGSASRRAAVASRQRRSSSRCSVFTTQKETSTATGLLLSPAVRVDVVDPSAYTPPYDHALCAALARAGARVRLVTSAFTHGAVPRAEGYEVSERFYRGAPARGRARVAWKLARHAPDMLATARAARNADIAHFQWLAVQPLDALLLRAFRRPVVLTAHDVLPREPRPGQRAGQRRLYARVDAIVVHSEHGRARLVHDLGVPEAKVTVIPHGVLPPAGDDGLPAELAGVDGPVALFFGLLRPYKGLDVLLEAWRGIEHAELWVVGMPRMDTRALRAAAPPGVRFVERFVPDGQVAALFRRADLAVLPYREIDQSGVLFTALGAGTPLLLSAVGGFPEIAAEGAAELVAAGDAAALHDALARLLSDSGARESLTAGARRAAAERYGWDAIARAHLDLYARLAGA